MGLIDWILNLTCALLWLNWRSLQFLSLDKSPPVSLAATLKKAEPRRAVRWLPLAALIGLLGLRSLFYWNVGSALNWTPSLELGVISLPFRSDYLGRMVLFSLLSFGLVLAGLYAWLLLLSVLNRKVSNEDPIQKLVRLQLGWVERWPIALKLLLPFFLSTLLWGVGSPLLVRLGILPAPISRAQVWEQAVLLGLTSVLVWKLLLLGICLLYLVNSYVYLGNSYFWNYANVTGANLLRPLRRLPVCFGKLDLSPVLGVLVVLAITHWGVPWLPRLFQRLPF